MITISSCEDGSTGKEGGANQDSTAADSLSDSLKQQETDKNKKS